MRGAAPGAGGDWTSRPRHEHSGRMQSRLENGVYGAGEAGAETDPAVREVSVVAWLSARDQVELGLLTALAATLLLRRYSTASAATQPLTAPPA